MLPADQRLGAGQARRVALDVVLRLVVDLELPFLHGGAQIVQQTLVAQFAQAHLLVVDHQGVLVVPAHHVAGRPRPVEERDRLHLRLPGHDAHADVDVDTGGDAVGPRLEAVQKRAVIRLGQAEDVEAVSLVAAGDALGLSEHGGDLAADAAQHLVAEVAPVHGVDRVELLDVQHDGVHVHLRMVLEHPVAVFHEEVAVVKPGEAVALRGGDQLPALAQLDDAADAGEDDLGHVEGLGNEVRGAQLERLQLRALFRGQDDDGDAAEDFVVPDGLQDLKAAHHGHHQVQQDQGEVGAVLAHQLHAFFSVFGVENFVVILENHAQDVPVDLLIVHDQDELGPLNLFGSDHFDDPPFVSETPSIRRFNVE